MSSTFGIILYPDSVSYSSILQLSRIIHAYEDKCDIAWIWHQPEPSDSQLESSDKKAHLHLMVSCRDTLSIDKFQRDFDISGHCIQKLNSKADFIRYLVHRTPDSRNKIQYALSELHSNFDIQPYFKSLTNNSLSESAMVLDIVAWAVRNNATYYQILSYVSHKGYSWQKFRMNSNIIFRVIDDELSVPSSQRIKVLF